MSGIENTPDSSCCCCRWSGIKGGSSNGKSGISGNRSSDGGGICGRRGCSCSPGLSLGKLGRSSTDNDGMVLPSPLTTPTVNVPDKPNGLPIAITCSPILTCEEFPKDKGISFDSDIFSTRSTAISLKGSDPTTQIGMDCLLQ